MAATLTRFAPPRPLDHALVGIELLIAFWAFAGGYGLAGTPSGAALGFRTEWLAGTPFDSYLVPGLVLADVVGGLALGAAWAVWRRRPWAPVAAAFSGGALAVWIGVQVAMVGYLGFLQPLCFAVGLLVLGLAVTVAARAPWASPAAGFYVRWVLTNGWSEAAGLGGTALVAGAIALAAPAPPSVPLTLLSAVAVVAAGAGLEGALVGYAQARVLQRRLPGLRRRDWVVATTLGAGVAWALGMVPSTLATLFIDPGAGGREAPAFFEGPLQYVAAAGMGLVLGPVLGAPQWLVLRRHVRRAGWWVPANAAAWAVGMPLVFLGAGAAFEAPGPAMKALVGLGALAVTGLAVGAVHGAVLVGLVRGAFAREAPPDAST